MDTRRSYDRTAEAYADGVRGLFAPAPAGMAERAATSLAAAEDLATRAERLEPVSADLTQAALVRLASDDPKVRARASTDLLAKALSDLEISRLLYEEASQAGTAGVSSTERSVSSRAERGVGKPTVMSYLDILTHKEGPTAPGASRARSASAEGATDARTLLADDVAAAFSFIPETAAKTGQNALNGLLALGMKNLAQAAGAVGMDVARYLGVGDWVSRLYQLFQKYVIRAYEAIMALIGNQVAKAMADKVLAWFEEVKAGKEFERLLNELYQTNETEKTTAKTIQDSKASPEVLAAAAADVTALRSHFEANIDLADKLIKGLGYLAWVHLTALPQAQLLMAAGYIAVAAYVILAGGDAVDAPSLKQFDYTPGVVEILKARLV